MNPLKDRIQICKIYSTSKHPIALIVNAEIKGLILKSDSPSFKVLTAKRIYKGLTQA